MADIEGKLSTPIVQEQLRLLGFRNTFPAFGFDSKLTIDDSNENTLKLEWSKDNSKALLHADLNTFEYEITHSE